MMNEIQRLITEIPYLAAEASSRNRRAHLLAELCRLVVL